MKIFTPCLLMVLSLTNVHANATHQQLMRILDVTGKRNPVLSKKNTLLKKMLITEQKADLIKNKKQREGLETLILERKKRAEERGLNEINALTKSIQEGNVDSIERAKQKIEELLDLKTLAELKNQQMKAFTTEAGLAIERAYLKINNLSDDEQKAVLGLLQALLNSISVEKDIVFCDFATQVATMLSKSRNKSVRGDALKMIAPTSEDSCLICMGEFNQVNPAAKVSDYATPCPHIPLVHKSCLDRSLIEGGGRCPLCKKPLENPLFFYIKRLCSRS